MFDIYMLTYFLFPNNFNKKRKVYWSKVYNKEELNKLIPNKYKRLLGVDFATVCKMETIVKNTYIEKHKKGGRNSKFTFHEMIILFLLYIKNYNAMEDYNHVLLLDLFLFHK
mgnify:CR=1 FL=1